MLRLRNLAIAFIVMAASFATASSAFAQMLTEKPADTTSLDRIRAAYREGRDADAIVLSDRALAEMSNDPGTMRAEVHFWRGAALRRLKRNEEALVALDQARDLGFATSELHLERALALRALGKAEEAHQEYQEAEKGSQEDPPKLEELRRRWRESGDQEKKFQLRVYPQLGYDSNVIGVSSDAVLAQEVQRSSFYYGVKLDARYALYEERQTSLLLDYQNNLRAYGSDSGLSFSDNLLSVIWHSPFGKSDMFAYEVRGSLGETYLNGEGHFRTQRTVAPALLFRPNEQWQVKLWGDYTNVDYYESTPDAQDRDGDIYRIGLTVSVDLGDGWKVAPYATFWRYNADGSDYDHHAWEVGANLTPPEFAGFLVTVGAGFVAADYDHPHSLTGFTEARSDHRFVARLSVTFKQLEKALGFAPTISIAYEKWSSNISAFDFDRWDFGFSTDILAVSF